MPLTLRRDLQAVSYEKILLFEVDICTIFGAVKDYFFDYYRQDPIFAAFGDQIGREQVTKCAKLPTVIAGENNFEICEIVW